jgi:hypothetical protein
MANPEVSFGEKVGNTLQSVGVAELVVVGAELAVNAPLIPLAPLAATAVIFIAGGRAIAELQKAA